MKMDYEARKNWWEMLVYPDGIEFLVDNSDHLTITGKIIIGLVFGSFSYLFGWLCLLADVIVVLFIGAVAGILTVLAGVLRLLIKAQPDHNKESLREIYWSLYNEMRNDD